MLTREEAHRQVLRNCGFVTKEFIDQIFDEHEAQLKAKDEEIERLKEVIKDLNEQIEDYEQFSETIASARG